MWEIIGQIALGLILMSLGISLFVIVRAEVLDDKDRESIGHGPKGQGR